MKSKNKKRIIALMLCMVMTLSGGVSALAEDANAENVNSEENVQEVQDDPVMLAEEETSEPEAAPEAEPAVTETPAAPPKESTVAPEEPTAPEAEPEAEAPEEALEPYEATYENADVIIKVSANEGIVPEGAELSVTPIEKKEITSDMTAEEKTEAEKINKQHEETEQKLQEESEKKENTLEGFLAYDISFLVNGQEVEPNGDVDVEMSFKKAALPEGMDAEIAKEAEVSVMHLEENQDGTVKKVVDMGKQNKVKTMKTTDEKKVQKVAFDTNSFSIYTITWNNGISRQISGDTVVPVGGTIQLHSDQTGTTHSWSSSNSNIAKVDGNGQNATVTGVKASNTEVTITHQYKNGNRNNKDTIKITVVNVKNFNNNDINYPQMLKDLEAEKFGITDWTRSSNSVAITPLHQATEAQKWKWSQVSGLNTSITEPSQVWDGSRSLTHNFTNYLPNNTVTADSNKLYDSATWKHTQGENNKIATMNRFRGTFTLGENENPNDYAYTLAQVVGDKNKIYINDDIYVFVYPEGTTLNNSNFADYLAFWTGTAYAHNKDVTFQGIGATKANQDKDKTEYKKLTDGWNIDAVDDNIGNAIINGYKNGARKFVVDVFADDYADGGGMYRMDLKKTEVRRTSIKFKKVEAGTSKPLAGAKFYLVDSSGNGRQYDVTSDEKGMCDIPVVDGTYTMTEVQAPTGYDGLSTTWTVQVQNGKATIKNGNLEIVKDNRGIYYIENTKTPETPGGGGTVDTEKDLSHEKYIHKNEDGTYDLTLNVSGAVGTVTNKAKLDVIFVMDTSSSMEYLMDKDQNAPNGYNGPTSRFQNQKKAVQEAVQAIAAKPTVDARYAIASFNQKGTINQQWTSSSNLSYPNSVAIYTNYEAGLTKAKELLQTARPEATKVVVFISDGDVTSYGTGNSTTNGSGNTYYPAGMTHAQNVLKTMTMNCFYTVGVGPSGSYTHLKELLNVLPDSVTKGSYNGTDSSNLKNAFDEIMGDITNLRCTNVTVTDKLSEYVEIVPGNNSVVNLEIRVKDEKGEIIGNGNNSLNIDGTTITARYDATNKTIVLDFADNYELHAGYTYYVTAKVKPSDEAYSEYAEQGKYPHTGDAFTDENFPSRNDGIVDNNRNDGTSSSQPGFHSNDQADVTYTYDGENKKADYDHPVVQVEVADLDLKKTTVNGTEMSGAEFKLSKYNEQEAKWEVLVEKFVVDNNNPEEALTKIKPGRYKLEETKAPTGCSLLDEKIYFKQKDGIIILTNAGGEDLTNIPDNMWELSENKSTLTIKNEILYELPDSGGSGIYWYMIGGMLLMLAAALILYKDRCKEVLRK